MLKFSLLHSTAIERLRAIKFSKPNSQLASNASQALNFLDRATSGKFDIPESRVVLQGPLEQFEVWDDAQRFFLPEFEEEVVPEKPDDEKEKENAGAAVEKEQNGKKDEVVQPVALNEMSQMLLSKLNIQKIAETEPVAEVDTANEITDSNDKDKKEEDDANELPTPIFAPPPTPDFLKPLLSCVLWQLHNAPAPNSSHQPTSSSMKLLAPLNSWVLITNDWTVRNWAIKFGIQVKTIHQLRTAILYEEKEYKNHVRYMERNQAQQQQQQVKGQIQPEQKQNVPAPVANGNVKAHDDDDTDTSEDELVFVPRGAKLGTSTPSSAAATAKPATAAPARVPTSTPSSHIHRKSNSRDRTASNNTPNHATAVTAAITSTPISITDSSSLLEAKSSPVVEIPSSPIDPDSFSRNIVVSRSPLAQGRTPSRPHNHGFGHGHGHGHHGRAGSTPRGPKTPEGSVSAAAGGMRGGANAGRGGSIPSGPRRRNGNNAANAGRGSGGAGRGLGGGVQRGRGRLWVP